MTRLMWRLEWRLLLRDKAYWGVFAFFMLLCGVAASAGRHHMQAVFAATADMRAGEVQSLVSARQLAEQATAGKVRLSPYRDPRDPGAFSRGVITTYAIQVPLAGQALAIGQSDLLPWYFKIDVDTRDKLATAYEYENPHKLLLGSFDFAFVLVYLFPIFLVVVGHTVRTHDIQQGTAQMLAANARNIGRLHGLRLLLRCLPLWLGAVATEWLVIVLAEPASSTMALFSVADQGVTWTALSSLYALFWFCAIQLPPISA